jgi:hypothetical protein
MTKLGTAIAEQVTLNYGQSNFLTRLSDPFWLQAYGAVMGMDWHSSGITTSVSGALKCGVNPRFLELGLMFCGGRGHHSVRTPDELRAFSLKNALDGDALARTSRLTARVDNNNAVSRRRRRSRSKPSRRWQPINTTLLSFQGCATNVKS